MDCSNWQLLEIKYGKWTGSDCVPKCKTQWRHLLLISVTRETVKLPLVYSLALQKHCPTTQLQWHCCLGYHERSPLLVEIMSVKRKKEGLQDSNAKGMYIFCSFRPIFPTQDINILIIEGGRFLLDIFLFLFIAPFIHLKWTQMFQWWWSTSQLCHHFKGRHLETFNEKSIIFLPSINKKKAKCPSFTWLLIWVNVREGERNNGRNTRQPHTYQPCLDILGVMGIECIQWFHLDREAIILLCFPGGY